MILANQGLDTFFQKSGDGGGNAGFFLPWEENL